MKPRLMAPGPTPVAPETLLAMARPAFHHRTPAFRELFHEVNEGLKYLFQTENPVLTFAGSGTGAMEAAVSNLLCQGDQALVVRGGKFGERWGEICEAYGVNAACLDVEWGEAVNPDDIANALDENRDIKSVHTTLCETSTATLTDIKAVGAVVKDTGAVLVVDAISALGGDELRADDWHVDCVIAGSQKGLMLPPGLSFISVSSKAREAVERSTLPKYYFSIERALDSYEKDDTPWTPAVSLVVGLGETLRTIREEGIDNVFARHARLAMATRAGMTGMGLDIFSKSPANIVTAVKMPQGVDGLKVLSSLRDDLELTPAGGQAKLKGKIIRIAHLGYVDDFDVVTAVSALELALLRNGAAVKPGSGVAAVQEAFAGV